MSSLVNKEDVMSSFKEDFKEEVNDVKDVSRRMSSFGSACDEMHQGSTIVFKDVCISIKKKEILQNVYGYAKVGQMLAVMGPSGAGKSTLLNTLSGRIELSSGRITVNGELVNRHLRRSISYVQQNDVFYSDLTLKETLTFAAMLRLPEAMPSHLKLQRIQEIVDLLELNKCFNTKIGGTFVTGLSGGERKRASVACELLTNPKLLLLDEPTSGLDSAIAYSIMSTLAKYCEQSHKTVVTTIHQPSSQIFHMFTNLLLITDGKVAYFGPGCKVIEFFSKIGLTCDPLYNPADFVLEKVKSTPETVKNILEEAKVLRKTISWPDEDNHHISKVHNIFSGSESNRTIFEERLNRNCRDQILLVGCKNVVQEKRNFSIKEVDVDKYIIENSKWQTGFLMQYSVLIKRTFLHSRSRYLSISVVAQVLFMAAFAGLEWFQTPRKEETARDRLGILFYVTVVMGFFPMMYSVFAMIDESGVFTRERSAGIYRLSAYYLAKTTTEIPSLFCLVTVYSIIVYWMTGLMPKPANFMAHWIILVLQTFTSQSLAMLIGICVNDRSFALIFLQSFLVGSLLAGGFYNTHAKWWFKWIKYISYINYAFGALSKVEFAYGDPLTCGPADSTKFPIPCAQNGTREFPGEQYLESVDLNFIPIYFDIIILICVMVVSRIVGYFILRFLRRPKI